MPALASAVGVPARPVAAGAAWAGVLVLAVTSRMRNSGNAAMAAAAAARVLVTARS